MKSTYKTQSIIYYYFHLIFVFITLFRSITMFRGTDSILLNIPPFGMNVRNVLQNIVSPTEHCYGHEYCYVGTQEKEV